MDIGRLTHGALSRLYSPELALLMRRMYDATVIGRGIGRVPYGLGRPSFTPLGQPVKVASNTSRDQALLVYLEMPFAGGVTYTVSSAPGPAGGGSDFVGSAGQSVGTFGTQRYVMRPSEDLWVTQRTGAPSAVVVFSEYY